MRDSSLLRALWAVLVAAAVAQRDGSALGGKGRSSPGKPLYPAPDPWLPSQGNVLDWNFEKWGATHTPEGKLQQRPEPMMETLGCLLGRIPPRYGGSPTKMLALLIPKTGTRHLQAILDSEYGRREFMTRCHPCPVVHYAPRMEKGMFAEGWQPDEKCQEDAKVESEKNTLIWNEIMKQMVFKNLKLITVVRKPLPYFLSIFSFRMTFDPQHESAVSELARFISREVYSSNMQLGFLVRKRNYGNKCIMGHSVDVTRDDLLEVRRLLDERRLLAGTCEQLEATVRMFHKELGWKTFDPDQWETFEPRTTNRTDKFRNGDVTTNKLREEDLPSKTLADIRRISVLDQELYDDVSSRLAEYVPPSNEL